MPFAHSRRAPWISQSLRIAAFLLAGCAPTVSSPPRRTAPAPTAAPHAPPSATVTWLPVRRSEEPRVVGVSPDGVTRVLYGSLRAELLPDGVVLGDDRFAETIDEVTQTARGWIFRAGAAIAASDTFLGPLRRLDTGWQDGAVDRNRGRLAAIDTHGDIWTTDGSAPIARVTSLPHAFAFGVAFASAQFGAAVLEPGELLATHDGGSTWRRIDTGGIAAEHVALVNDRIAVSLPAGERVLGEDDSLSAQPPESEPDPVRLSDEDDARLRHAVHQRYPAYHALAHDRRSPDLRRRDGSVVRLVRDPERATLVRVDRHTGAEVERAAITLPDAECELESWGTAFVVACAEGTFFRCGSIDTCTEQHAPIPARPEFSDDGVHAMLFDSCASPTPSMQGNSNAHACGLRSDGRWVELQRTAGQVVATAMHESSVAYSIYRGNSGEPEPIDLEVLDVETGVDSAVALPSGAPPHTDVERIRWFDDGTMAVTLRRDPLDSSSPIHDRTWCGMLVAVPVVLIGSLENLAFRATPTGTASLDFASGREGVAAGATLAELWRTRDGARTWQRVDLAVDGDPANVSLQPGVVDWRSWRQRDDVRCDDGACTVSDTVHLEGFDDFVPSRARLLTAPIERDCPGPDRYVEVTRDDIEPWVCERVPAPRHAPVHVASPPIVSALWPPERGGGELRFRSFDGETVRVRVTDARAPRFAGTFAWRGSDERGAFSRSARVEHFVVGTENEAVRDLRLLDVNRSGVLFALVAPSDEPGCALAWITPAGARRVSAWDAMSGGECPVGVMLVDRVVRPDGSVLAALTETRGEVALAAMIELRPDGSDRLIQLLALRPETRFGLGTYRGVAGYFAVAGEAGSPVRFWSGGRGVELPPLGARPLRACRGARDADAAVLRWWEEMPFFEREEPEGAMVTVESARGGACVRGIAWPGRGSATVGEDGVIRGVVRGGEGVRCGVAAAIGAAE